MAAATEIQAGTSGRGGDVFNGIIDTTSLTVTNSFGEHLYASVTTVNNAGIESPASAGAGVALINPAWIPLAGMNSPNALSWNSVSGKIYQVWSTTNLAVPFSAYSGMITATAPTLTFTTNSANAARYFKIEMFP